MPVNSAAVHSADAWLAGALLGGPGAGLAGDDAGAGVALELALADAFAPELAEALALEPAAALPLGLAGAVGLAVVPEVVASSAGLWGLHAASEAPSPSTAAKARSFVPCSFVERFRLARSSGAVIMPPLFRAWIPESTGPAANAQMDGQNVTSLRFVSAAKSHRAQGG